MAVVNKYVVVTPKDISSAGGVYTMTLPTAALGFTAVVLAQDYQSTSVYEAGKDTRQLWVLKGEEADLNNWINANSSMVVEKTFAEADAIGKELQPSRDYTVRKIITEDGVVTEESDIVKNIAVFDLQTKLTELGL